MTKEVIFDLEADGLLDTITKIHCVSYGFPDTEKKVSLTKEDEIYDFFSQDMIYIGHYISGYDFKALKMIYGIPKPKLWIDTIGWAWYLDQGRGEYGLESYGEQYGVPKPPIADWVNDTLEVYKHRCETDVEINRRLYNDFKKRMKELYND